MANFVALTPPLGQQPWGPVLILAPLAPLPPTTTNALPVALPTNLSLADFGYPPLNSLFRTIILSKHPGTIFPDPRLKDVFPCPDLDPVHVEELWVKYDEVLGGDQTSLAKLPGLLERELSVWIAEFDASQGPTTVVVAGADLMEVDMAKSKKRARRDSSEDDATTEKKVRAAKKSKAGKKSNKYKKPKQTPIPILTMKSHYDAAFPVDAVVDQNMPAYLMAKNYIDIYAKSNEKYAARVREIIAKQGMEPITQRCAKFFAWGLKQPILSSGSASNAVATTTAPIPAAPVYAQPTAAQLAPVSPVQAAAIQATPTAAIQSTATQITTNSISNPDEDGDESGVISPTNSKKSTQQVFEYWEYHADVSMRETSPNGEPFPEYIEPDLSEYMAIMDDIYNYGADGSVGSVEESLGSVDDSVDDSVEDNIGSVEDNVSSVEDSPDEVINFKPTNKKPSFHFEPSTIASQLPSFLSELKAANDALDASRMLELDEEDEGEHIEMNLGLGVLEEEHLTSEDEDEAEAEKSVLIKEI